MAQVDRTIRANNFKDLTGKRFGRLLVFEFDGIIGAGRKTKSQWKCKCDCGKIVTKFATNLLKGTCKSCGCLGLEKLELGRKSYCAFVPPDKIIINGKYVCLVDPDKLEELSKYKWHLSRSGKSLYARCGGYPRILMHVLLMGRKGVDHKNGNGLDNRLCNLRFASSSQNAINRRKLKSSQSYRGVVPPQNRRKFWYFRITINGKQCEFGKFLSAEEAARAYDQKAQEIHGEFAVLNFPEINNGN